MYPQWQSTTPHWPISQSQCQSTCCYPEWLWEDGYDPLSSLPPDPSQGGSGSPPNDDRQADWEYDLEEWCQQEIVDDLWDHWDFDDNDWDEGFGLNHGCDRRFPLGRTWVALYLLRFSWTTSTPTDTLGNVLRNAYDWARDMNAELDARCAYDSGNIFGATAVNITGPLADDRTVLFWRFFYGTSVGERAAVIIHETRHQDGCGHNGSGTSEDHAWNDGCSWGLDNDDGMSELPENAGANQCEAIWGWAFYRYGQNTTPAVRGRMLNSVNSNLGRFENSPCFRVGGDGEAYTVPHSLCHYMETPTASDTKETVLKSEVNAELGEPELHIKATPGSGDVTYNGLPPTMDEASQWKLRQVDITTGNNKWEFARWGTHQIYTTWNSLEYCLYPIATRVWHEQQVEVDPQTGPVMTGLFCEDLYVTTPVQVSLGVTPCSLPNEGDPQESTWFQVVNSMNPEYAVNGGSDEQSVYQTHHDFAFLRPTLRCREGSSTGVLALYTLNDSQCIRVVDTGAPPPDRYSVVGEKCSGMVNHEIWDIVGWY